ncbi:MAG: hypothetical protein GX270_14405 [Clostridiaceae bacterium]|nr:hypothetical protein [Clostridiaceae bacterium]
MNIKCPSSILFGWIKEHYKAKNSKYLITSTSLGKYKAIIQLDELEHWFTVSACLRRKKVVREIYQNLILCLQKIV